MSEFTFVCPECEQEILVAEDVIGVDVECPHCQKVITVTSPESDINLQDTSAELDLPIGDQGKQEPINSTEATNTADLQPVDPPNEDLQRNDFVDAEESKTIASDQVELIPEMVDKEDEVATLSVEDQEPQSVEQLLPLKSFRDALHSIVNQKISTDDSFVMKLKEQASEMRAILVG